MTTVSGASPWPPLLLAAHGTACLQGRRQTGALVELVCAALPHVVVRHAYLELAQPDIETVIAEFAGRAARTVVVVPVMLLAAGHVKADLPAVLERAGQRHRQVQLHYGRDLGVEPRLTARTVARVTTLLGSHDRSQEGATAVVLVGRGTSDPQANGHVGVIAAQMAEALGLSDVEVAFAGVTGPTVTEGLVACRDRGARHIIVVPYLLFQGRLVERIRLQAAAFTHRTGTATSVSGPFGPDAIVAALLAERYEEVATALGRSSPDAASLVWS